MFRVTYTLFESTFILEWPMSAWQAKTRFKVILGVRYKITLLLELIASLLLVVQLCIRSQISSYHSSWCMCCWSSAHLNRRKSVTVVNVYSVYNRTPICFWLPAKFGSALSVLARQARRTFKYPVWSQATAFELKDCCPYVPNLSLGLSKAAQFA